MKQRFSSLDVKVIAHELSASLVSLRLYNIYDLSSKILLFKFAKPDNKKQLLVDCGFRCHLTEFERTTAALPSVFVQKLRKDLKSRRVTAVSQIGTDRIIEFQFSDGLYRLYFEFFASGNVILTNNELKILTLMRHVPQGEGQEPQQPGLTYSLENRQNYGGVPPLTKTRLKEALQAIIEKNAASVTGDKKAKKRPGDELRKGLAITINELPPVLLDHAMKVSGFDSTVQPVTVRDDEALLDHLLRSLEGARRLVQDITSADTCNGYIFAKSRTTEAKAPSTETGQSDRQPRENLLYEDFHPFLPRQLEEDSAFTILPFDSFGKTVDEFFSSIEGQKLRSRLTEREATAKQKLDAAKADQAKRIEGLQAVQTLNIRKASAIEANIERVQEAMDAVNVLIRHGMDWEDIGKLIEREKQQGNPVAAIISLPLKLHENTITVLLGEAEDGDTDEGYNTDSSDESSSESDKDLHSSPEVQSTLLAVDINLGMSPYSNAREYYEERKVAAVKEQKTKHQSEIALKSAGQKIEAELKKGLKQEKSVLQPVRQQAWFEKYIWFVSTDGYLVLGGKDAQQNELLYRRYLKKGDIYVHADLHGAASVIIKNNPNTPDAPIPPSTLSQAGSLVVCSSSAWDSKASMSAWWVTADQVSKSAPTGEFLPPGSFTVGEKKNFLPASQLIMGLALMFKISDGNGSKRVKHRLYDTSADSEISPEAPVAPTDTSPVDIAATEGIEATAEGDPYTSIAEQESRRREPAAQSSEGSAETRLLDTTAEVTALQQVDRLAISEYSVASKAPELNQGQVQDEKSMGDEEVVTDTDTIPTSNQDSSSTRKSSIQAQKKSQPTKRGQRAKAKKIAAKYKDQDEDDRAAIEALVGASAGRQRAEAEAKAKAEREAVIEATRERRRAQHQRLQRQTAEHEETRKLMLDESTDVLDPDEIANLSLLDSLVGTPSPGDEILEVVAVCAPYAALGRCKYKFKLQPGTQKKGKAVKEMLEMWKAVSTRRDVVDEKSMDKERMWPREVELIKAIKLEEVVNAVPLKSVKVMTIGGSGGNKGGGGGGKGKAGGKGGKKK
ncbi:fibronectin-binding protein A N-terminus-domain-containing protein [Xylaria intraflava]|nr:fibronectin-binding protein A N-terminus-domain-containing protein [Xylaria intraflava]